MFRQKSGTAFPVVIETIGLCVLTGGVVILCPSSRDEVKRTVAERAHMKVVLRTLGRDASVADWLTRLFQTIICLSARWLASTQ